MCVDTLFSSYDGIYNANLFQWSQKLSKCCQVLLGTSVLFITSLSSSPDSQKRAIYDRSGSDPEDRFGGMPSRSSGFATSPFGNGDGELSPEDLFNMFFGGGGGGGFGGGPTGRCFDFYIRQELTWVSLHYVIR